MSNHNEGWTLPLEILIVSTLTCGLVAVMVVFLLH
jgi:hypothetical protein